MKLIRKKEKEKVQNELKIEEKNEEEDRVGKENKGIKKKEIRKEVATEIKLFIIVVVAVTEEEDEEKEINDKMRQKQYQEECRCKGRNVKKEREKMEEEERGENAKLIIATLKEKQSGINPNASLGRSMHSKTRGKINEIAVYTL